MYGFFIRNGLRLVSFTSFAFLVSCGVATPSPPLELGPGDLNNQVHLAAPAFMNSFKTTDPLWLELSNTSGERIRFAPDYGIRVFWRSATGWSEIGEMPTERIPEDHVLYAPGTGLSTDLVAVLPALGNEQVQYSLRIYVMGRRDVSKDNSPVAAFVDVELRP